MKLVSIVEDIADSEHFPKSINLLNRTYKQLPLKAYKPSKNAAHIFDGLNMSAPYIKRLV
jgi:hypothetical protein